jgi:hypothetical protein
MRGRVDTGAAVADAVEAGSDAVAAGTDDGWRAGAASLDEQAIAAIAAQDAKTLREYNMLRVL